MDPRRRFYDGQDLPKEEETTKTYNCKEIKGVLPSTCQLDLDRIKHHHKEWISIEIPDKIQERKNHMTEINNRRKRAQKMMVVGSRQETMDSGFVPLGTRQQSVPVILRGLVLPEGFDPVSPSFTVGEAGLYLRQLRVRKTASPSSAPREKQIRSSCHPVSSR
ncbi:unnamed protein product [Schistosoma curassoni]|uniref:Nuclear transcription factor Y subunit n=1 Tax=Schistosoma curassoni TaxID=6186 RepID=A0A183KXJ2_9TREM|nr:unnamed protein product [Schistosoma curassoni]